MWCFSVMVGEWLVTMVVIIAVAVAEAEKWVDEGKYIEIIRKGLAGRTIHSGYMPRVLDGCVAQW